MYAILKKEFKTTVLKRSVTMKRVSGILWGIVLAAVGVIIALSGLGIITLNLFFEGWWTLFIIVPCLIGLITDSDKTGSIIGICIGVLLLLACRKVLSFMILWKLILAAIIIIIGLRLIFGSIFSAKGTKVFKSVKKNGQFKNGTAVFAGTNLRFDNELFDGAELAAIFGGLECDLRNAVISGDCAIKATAVFGGITIYAPEGLTVKINSTSVFGGADDQRSSKQSGEHTLYINAACVFGGVTVK